MTRTRERCLSSLKAGRCGCRNCRMLTGKLWSVTITGLRISKTLGPRPQDVTTTTLGSCERRRTRKRRRFGDSIRSKGDGSISRLSKDSLLKQMARQICTHQMHGDHYHHPRRSIATNAYCNCKISQPNFQRSAQTKPQP